MSIKTKHPLYDLSAAIWKLCRDSYGGQTLIKAAGAEYLPATYGQIQDGFGGTATNSIGELDYLAYKTRAVYPDNYRESIKSSIGTMHRKPPPEMLLPTSMETLLKTSTSIGEPLSALIRRVNVEQHKSGRVGVLGDLKISEGVTTPILSVYKELAILNWDDSLSDSDSTDVHFVVLDESTYKLSDNYTWDEVEQYRVLALCTQDGDGKLTPSPSGTIYATAVILGSDDISSGDFVAPSNQGITLTKIPFAFINSGDISPSPDLPPLLGLAELCLTIYRGEADYRRNLFMQGQDTLVEIGNHGIGTIDGTETLRTGAGSRLLVPIGGDAKYIGVNSLGLPEQRACLENDYSRASNRSGQLQDAVNASRESGEALSIRVSAGTTTLPQLAHAGTTGISNVIKAMTPWFRAVEDDVSIKPNLDFVNEKLDAQTITSVANLKSAEVTLSDRSIHGWLAEGGLTKMTYEEELEEIARQEPSI